MLQQIMENTINSYLPNLQNRRHSNETVDRTYEPNRLDGFARDLMSLCNTGISFQGLEFGTISRQFRTWIKPMIRKWYGSINASYRTAANGCTISLVNGKQSGQNVSQKELEKLRSVIINCWNTFLQKSERKYVLTVSLGDVCPVMQS